MQAHAVVFCRLCSTEVAAMILKRRVWSLLFTLLIGGVSLAVAQSEVSSTAQESTQNTQRISTAVLSGEAVFDYNTFHLSAAAVTALNKLINDLNGFVAVDSVKVIGHTDDVGSDKYNRQLSEKRARFIARFFARRFPDIEVSALGVGESSPIATNTTAEGRQRNRRVEIQVIARGVKP